MREIEAILQREFDAAEREEKETVANVQKEVQEQAAENAMCLNDCESMELCDTSEMLQMFAEYTEGDKADMHAAGFAVNGVSIDAAFDINDSVFDLDFNGGGSSGRAEIAEIDHGDNEEDFDVADCM